MVIPLLRLEVGLDGRVIACTPGIPDAPLTISPAIVGKPVSEALPAELSDLVLAAAREGSVAERWYALEAQAIRDLAASKAEVVIGVRDISDEQRTREALRVSEARHRLLADSARDVVWTMSPDGRITYISPAIEKVRGYTPAEAMAQPMEEIFPPESLARSVGYFTEMLITLQAGGVPEPFRGDLEYNCKDGSTFWTEVLAYPVLDDHGALVELLGVTRDLTGRRALEAEARSEQRLESMGRMASGVAHEVNNAIAIIRASAELLPREVPESLEGLKLRANIVDSVDRVGTLTAQLLAFSRRQHVSPEGARLGDLVEGAHVLLDRIAGPAAPVAVVLEAGAADALLQVDREQFQQVLLHLVANARHAVAPGGPIGLRCGTTELRSPMATRTGRLAPGSYVTLVVEDGGVGMTAAVIEHLFDPFFTTKQQHEGMELGLPTVFGILKQNNAGLTVESEAGKGSRFTVLWPMHGRTVAAAVRSEVRAASVVVPARASSEGVPTVLVVDDEPVLLTLMARVVERLGYRAVKASCGVEALAIVREQGEAIAAIVTDIRMPGMSGIELMETLLREGIGRPVLFVSGQIDAPIPTEWPATMPRLFLPKPFVIDQVSKALVALGVRAAG